MRMVPLIFAGAAVVLGTTLIAGSASAATKRKQLDKDFAKRIAPYMASIRKWAAARKLPVQWVLATIKVETNGNPRAEAHSDREDSYGLMQVNLKVHGDRFGVTGAELSQNPDKAVEIGTLLMREFLDDLRRTLRVYPSPIPLDQLLRIAYTGPARVKSALQAGRDPVTLPQAADTVALWQRAVAQTAALV